MLHGSEGGSEHYSDAEANILATQGYAVLQLCYFGCNRGLTGPRQSLLGIEPTKVLDAVAWLRAQSLSNGKVIVYGFSRGAELSMIIGSLPTTQANRPSAIIDLAGPNRSRICDKIWTKKGPSYGTQEVHTRGNHPASSDC